MNIKVSPCQIFNSLINDRTCKMVKKELEKKKLFRVAERMNA